MRIALATLLSLALACGLGGCVVKDELKDGLREMRSEMGATSLTANADGSGALTFKFRYGIALVDDDGIEPFPWTFELLDRDRNVLAGKDQEMRKAEPGKTRVLVTGERARTLDVEPGRLLPGRTYVLWIVVRYRDEILHELLWPVTEGVPAQAPDDLPDDLPPMLPTGTDDLPDGIAEFE